jgi:hypothetical protein
MYGPTVRKSGSSFKIVSIGITYGFGSPFHVAALTYRAGTTLLKGLKTSEPDSSFLSRNRFPPATGSDVGMGNFNVMD